MTTDRQTDSYSNPYCLGSSTKLEGRDSNGRLLEVYVCPYCEAKMVKHRCGVLVCPNARVTQRRGGAWHSVCYLAPHWLQRRYWANEPVRSRFLHFLHKLFKVGE